MSDDDNGEVRSIASSERDKKVARGMVKEGGATSPSKDQYEESN